MLYTYNLFDNELKVFPINAFWLFLIGSFLYIISKNNCLCFICPVYINICIIFFRILFIVLQYIYIE
jgi:hypothetical protein